MSRIYDNWEKLVGAVLRRERDRELAYCESITTPYSTDLSSPSSFESLDILFAGDVHQAAEYYGNTRSWRDFAEVKGKIEKKTKASKVRLVRCPNCENILPEHPDMSLYMCGGCGAILKAKKKGMMEDRSSDLSNDVNGEGISVENSRVKTIMVDMDSSDGVEEGGIERGGLVSNGSSTWPAERKKRQTDSGRSRRGKGRVRREDSYDYVNHIFHRRQVYTSGFSNLYPLQTIQSLTLSSSDMDSENDGFNFHRPRKLVLAPGSGRVSRPIRGGAPFITCSNCSELLKLPRKYISTDKNQHELNCGACWNLGKRGLFLFLRWAPPLSNLVVSLHHHK